MSAAVAELRTAAAVRDRCTALFRAGIDDGLDRLRVDLDAVDRVAGATVAQIQSTHPDGPIPIHGRLNHLRSDDYDLTLDLSEQLGPSLLDFVICSVLVDAGAGPDWAFDDPTVGRIGRSEGLALASLRAMQSGCLHHDRVVGLSVEGLLSLDDHVFEQAFQVSASNPLLGASGRTSLLRAFGGVLADADVESSWELLRQDHTDATTIDAEQLLRWVLDRLANLWPGRIELEGENLGDTWRHHLVPGVGSTAGLVPFHKLSQWMTYSLVEPLETLGLHVTDLDELTGLAEYRNGGVFVELGMIVSNDGDFPSQPLPPDDLTIVEWRALTVAGLDLIADEVRSGLGPDRATLPLAALLEAGTWPLGRRLAFERSPAGAPPIGIISDGTVF